MFVFKRYDLLVFSTHIKNVIEIKNVFLNFPQTFVQMDTRLLQMVITHAYCIIFISVCILTM